METGTPGLTFWGEADDIPVSETNATVADGAADSFRFVRAVNPDDFFVQRNPDHADGTVRSGREHVEIAASPAILQHRRVPSESGQFHHALHSPFSNRRCRLRRTDRDRIRGR